jgi:hypothetical protein
VLLAGNVAAVKSRNSFCCYPFDPFAAFRLSLQNDCSYCRSSVGKKVTIYPLCYPTRTSHLESGVHRITMNNFATLISYSAMVCPSFSDMHLTNIASLIYQEKVSQRYKFNLHQSSIPLLKCCGYCDL